MIDGAHTGCMFGVIIILGVIVLGPLAALFGADSRYDGSRRTRGDL